MVPGCANDRCAPCRIFLFLPRVFSLSYPGVLMIAHCRIFFSFFLLSGKGYPHNAIIWNNGYLMPNAIFCSKFTQRVVFFFLFSSFSFLESAPFSTFFYFFFLLSSFFFLSVFFFLHQLHFSPFLIFFFLIHQNALSWNKSQSNPITKQPTLLIPNQDKVIQSRNKELLQVL
jgi:hypothetical protein